LNGLYTGYEERSHRVKVPSMVAIDAEFAIKGADDETTYRFDTRRGYYEIDTKNRDTRLQQRFYVHRTMKNIIVNEIRVELLQRKAVSIDLYNITHLRINFEQSHDWKNNPNRFTHYEIERNPDNMTYEQRIIREPTYIDKHQLNDGE
jgi:hypothetical protein